MIRFLISLTGLLLLSCLFQQFLPVISAWYDARILLLILVFLCCAVALPLPAMLLLAFIGGFLWDAQQIIIHTQGDPNVYQTAPANVRFGTSIILFALSGLFMQGIQPIFKQGKWHISALLTGVALFLYLLIELSVLSFIRGSFLLSGGILTQISLTSFITMLLSPIIFWLIFRIAALYGHTIQYEGLKRQTKYID